MAEQNPPVFLQAGTYPAEDVRASLGSLMFSSGVMGENDLLVNQSLTPAMSVSVYAGSVWVAGTEATYQGSYYCQNRGAKTLTISASNPSNPRRDLIVAKVQDAAYSGAVNSWSLSVVTGTPAGSPVDPAIPANSIVLARVRVAAAATTITNAVIDDLRQFGAARGGETVCKSTSRPSVPYVGQRIYESDTFKHLVFQSVTTGWTPPWNQPWGIMGIATVTANQTGIVGTPVDLTGASVTFTAVAGRRYRAYLETYIGSTVSGDIANFRICDGGGTQLQSGQSYCPGSGAVLKANCTLYSTFSSGSVTLKGQAVRGTGSGTLNTVASATAATFLVVEDIGPAANPT